MKLIIDRIEEDLAVCENPETKEMMEIPVKDLPKDIKEGSVLVFENNEYHLDLDEEAARRKIIREKFNKLRQD